MKRWQILMFEWLWVPEGLENRLYKRSTCKCATNPNSCLFLMRSFWSTEQSLSDLYLALHPGTSTLHPAVDFLPLSTFLPRTLTEARKRPLVGSDVCFAPGNGPCSVPCLPHIPTLPMPRLRQTLMVTAVWTSCCLRGISLIPSSVWSTLEKRD